MDSRGFSQGAISQGEFPSMRPGADEAREERSGHPVEGRGVGGGVEKREGGEKERGSKKKRKSMGGGGEGGERRRRGGAGDRGKGGGAAGDKRARAQCGEGAGSLENSPAKKGSDRTILQFFGKSAAATEGDAAPGVQEAQIRPLALSPYVGDGGGGDHEAGGGSWTQRELDLRKRENAVEAKFKALAEKETQLAQRADGIAKLEEAARERASVTAKQDIADAAALRRGHDVKVRELIKDLLIKSQREQRALNAAKLSADSMRVGRVSYVRSGMSVNEYWERGGAWEELTMRKDKLDKEKETLEKDRKAFQRRCKTGGGAGGAAGTMQPPAVPSDEQQEQEEIFRLRAQKFKEQEKVLADEREKLDREKNTLIRELKRSQDQLRSKYNNFPILNSRYLLLHLLGMLHQSLYLIHSFTPAHSPRPLTHRQGRLFGGLGGL